MYHSALPTGHNLSKRILEVDYKCKRCGVVLESDVHVLFCCWWSKEVWKVAGYEGLLFYWGQGSLADWLFQCYLSMTDLGFSFVIILCWLIWFARNQLQTEGKDWDPTFVVWKAQLLLKDFINSSSLYAQAQQIFFFGWQLPPKGWMKVNVDGARNLNSGDSSIAVVIGDDEGIFQAVRYIFLGYTDSVLAAESRALLEGLRMAKECSLEKVIFETDNIILVEALKKDGGVVALGKTWIKECCSKLSKASSWSLQAIRREANRDADYIAKYSLSFKSSWLLIDACPILVQNCLS